MVDNELLLSISELLDKKLNPIEGRARQIEMMLENDVLPRLQSIESCYTSTYRRYATGSEEQEALKADMKIVKQVVSGHSDKLKNLA